MKFGISTYRHNGLVLGVLPLCEVNLDISAGCVSRQAAHMKRSGGTVLLYPVLAPPLHPDSRSIAWPWLQILGGMFSEVSIQSLDWSRVHGRTVDGGKSRHH